MAFGSGTIDCVEGYKNGIDFCVIYDVLPPVSWWENFRYRKVGIDFRHEPTALAGWDDVEPFMERVRYLTFTQMGAPRRWDLSFLRRATRVELLRATPSSTDVDVSALSLKWFDGMGSGLKGIFGLPTLESVHFDKRWPAEAISSPVRDVTLRKFEGRLDYSALEHPAAVKELDIDRSKTVDVSALSTLTNLSSLTLWACARIDGIEAVLELPKLRRLRILDCPNLPGFTELRKLEGVTVTVSEKNVFDPEFRETVSRERRSKWSFPNVLPHAPGERWYLLHPGLPRPRRIDGPDTDGPGEWVASTWEDLPEIQQRERMLEFAKSITNWLTERGSAAVVDRSTGRSRAMSEFDVIGLMDSRESLDLQFIGADRANLAQITESIWEGVAVTSERPPSLGSRSSRR